MRIPVLTYHAVNVNGNDYANNDHVAFAADLRLIDDLGLRIVPLHWISDQITGRAQHDLSRCVALSCDDGTDLDFRDLEYRNHGIQRSLFNCIRDFINERGSEAQPDLHLTSFVIASPQARVEMDRGCLTGDDYMRDDWWPDAVSSGLMSIECHSWEHNHPVMGSHGIDGAPRGSFEAIDNHTRAEHEIAQAINYLSSRVNGQPVTQFAFPFGQGNRYLINDYLPTRGVELGLNAAWSTDGRPVSATDYRWNLPRYVCGWHWKSPAELRAILDGV